ncbi:MAG: hypothetical protein RBT65_03660 [Methanolobus sp.]|nr:hypothetical protein [Methanolobus sp.]
MSDLHNHNRILTYLDDMNERLKSLELRIIELESRNFPQIDDKMAVFLTVPDSIRKSLFAVSKLKSCTADEVSAITGRHRSIENKYLNELYRAGWLERERKGKKIYYSLSNKTDSTNNEHWSAVEEIENKLGRLLE